MHDLKELFERACDLDRSGADEEAKAAYLACLQQDPEHVEALTHLGNLAFRSGYRSAARTAYRQAVRCAPNDPVARVNLGNALLDTEDLNAARDEYEAALATDPGFAPAHQGLSYVFARLGDETASRKHRDQGFRSNPIMRIPYRGSGRPVRALVFISAAGGNFNTDWLLDSHRFDVCRIACEYADLDAPLPAHDVLVNAIGDADLCGDALRAGARLAAQSNAKVVNAPLHVLQTTRIGNAERLRAIPHVVTPQMAMIAREEIVREGEAALRARGFAYPFLLRTPGHHTGRHFVKVDDAIGLSRALDVLPGEDVLAIAYIDARSPDGRTRKYRVMLLGGGLYPVHAAVSRDWKVHYFTAEMAVSDANRAEDARFLEDPAAVLGTRGLAAIEEVAAVMQLDYAGVDFGIDSSGRVILFEANATMSIVPPDPGAQWVYRRPAIECVFNAFHAMLGAAAQPAAFWRLA